MQALDMSEVELAAQSVDPMDLEDIRLGLSGHDGGLFADAPIGVPVDSEDPNRSPPCNRRVAAV